MNAKTKTVVAVVLLVVLAGVGVTFWASSKTESKFREIVDRASKYGIKGTVVDYQRGFFSATARTTWELIPTRNSPFSVAFNHRIQHAPLRSLTAAARIQSELASPDENQRTDSTTTVNKPPFRIDSTIGWRGGSTYHFDMPKMETKFDKTNVELSWDTLNGEVSLGRRFSKIKTNVVIEGFSLAAQGGGQSQASRVVIKSDLMDASGFDSLSVGTLGVAVDKYVFGNQEQADATEAFTLVNARIDTDSTLNRGGLTLAINLSADRAEFQKGDSNTSIEKAGATLLLENIDAQAFDALSNAIGEKLDLKTIAKLREHLETLLRRNPSFSIKDFRARLPEGALTGNLRVAYAGEGNLLQISLFDGVRSPLLDEINVDLQLSIPHALVAHISDAQDNEPSSRKISLRTRLVFTALRKAGFLKEKDGILSVEASLRKGSLTVNGQKKSLKGLQKLLGF